MVMDSEQWKWVEAVPAILFSIDGQTQRRALRSLDRSRRMWVTVAEGTVTQVDADRLTLDDGVSLLYRLPEQVDLAPLHGEPVRLALHEEAMRGGPLAQTLVLADGRGRNRLLARFGPAEAAAHSIGLSRLRAALSQRPGGPLAFGTDKLQYVVHAGQQVKMRDASGEFVVRFVGRTAFDYAAYVVAERMLWQRR
jgi:hypothetical protein